MPKGREATQLVRDAMTCLRTIKKLDQCEPTSVLGALMTCAQLGLRPAVLGHAWPLPFWDNRSKCYKAQLVIGYQGYIELGHRSGKLEGPVGQDRLQEDREFDVWDAEQGRPGPPAGAGRHAREHAVLLLVGPARQRRLSR